MSEKRFEIIGCTVWMVDEDGEEELWNPQIVKILNKQQATITELESDKAIAEDYANIFEKENVKLRKKLNEQQDIIFKLQDLCGKSDYENAKLREEVNLLRPTNLEQYEQIQKLQEENEQLRRLFVEMKQPITIDLTEEDEKELRKLLGLIEDE